MEPEPQGCVPTLASVVAIPAGCFGALLTLIGWISFDAHMLPFLMIGFALLGWGGIASWFAFRAERPHHDGSDGERET